MMRVCDCISHLTWINTRFHGDGFGESCTNQSYDFTEDFLYVATSGVALFIILFIAYRGRIGLFQYKKIIFPLKMLFFLASSAGIFFTVLSIITICLCLMSYKKTALIVGSISTFVYAFLFLCIWANLILRLFVAFRGSAYKMHTREQRGYLLVFIYLVLNAFATSICQLLMLVGQGLRPSITVQLILSTSFMIVFAVSALVAVCTFMGNVFILGKSRTVKQVKQFCEEEPIALNEMQEKLMDLSSRYISLFIVASLSSLVTMFSGFYESISDLRISLFLVPIDCCVNLICIYLQYAFAESPYKKYCGGLDKICSKVITAGWVRSIHLMRRKEHDRTCSKKVDLQVQHIKDGMPKLSVRTARSMKTISERMAQEVANSDCELPERPDAAHHDTPRPETPEVTLAHRHGNQQPTRKHKRNDSGIPL